MRHSSRLKKDMSAATTRWVATEPIAPRLGRAYGLAEGITTAALNGSGTPGGL
jgi:hypothetical protein